MEISKGLQQEIQLVQNKLKNAIRDHQICVEKLKDDPNNADILERIQEIQLHIVALGRCQKQVIQRLRKEVEAFKPDNASEVKVSVASLLGLNNNNHITANNEATTDEISEVKIVTNGLDNVRLATAKEDYEEIVRNGDVTTPTRGNVRKKQRSLSVETLSAEEEVTEVVEVDDNSRESQHHELESPPAERKVNCGAQLNFLEILGLITTSKFIELQNRRAERKRRSTANPQFVYSNWEIPTKRKRHNYLQSATNVPQTRQTTARLNGPSPPPVANKSVLAVPPPKSISPPTRTLEKSLIPTQKATTRPNILRNMNESRVFVNKSRIENGEGQVQLSSCTKTPQSTTNSKTVHIAGLPLGLTIERIENDSAVCINCRNPGTLSNCDNCEANYHVSCHLISPPPPRLCPKCALRLKDYGGPETIKKNEELVAASYAPGVVGKAGEDPEINKASCGLYKLGAAAKQQQQQQQQQIIGSGRGVNQLLSSTFLIPISSNALAAAGAFNQSDNVVADSSSLDILKSSGNNDAATVANSANEVPYSTSLVIGNQLSRSSITYVPQSQSHVSYAYQLPANSTETSQSYIIVKKITEPGKPSEGQQAAEGKNFPTTSGYNTLCGGEGTNGQPEVPITNASLQLDKLTGRLAESIARGWKKSKIRAIPGLNRIAHAEGKSNAVATDRADNNDMDKLSDSAYNVRSSTNREQKRKFDGNKLRTGGRRRKETSRGTRDFAEPADKRAEMEITKITSKKTEQQGHLARKKFRSKPHSSELHSMFSGYNKSNIVANRPDESRKGSEADGNAGTVRSDEIHEPDVKLSRNEPMGDQSNCSDLASSIEHVKLEEAHLSAPLRAKLVCDDDTVVVNTRKPFNRLQNTARMLSNRRRTTEDRVKTPPIVRAFDESKHERNRPRILMRPERKSLDSTDSVLNESAANSRKYMRDLVIFEQRYGGIVSEAKKVRSSSDTDSADEISSSDTSASDGTSTKALATAKDEESKRKDLTSEERETGPNDGDDIDSADEEIDEGDEDEIEEEEEEDQEDCPILDEDINERVNERLGISSVSPESMQVLEQFESAMLQVDSGDLTANR